MGRANDLKNMMKQLAWNDSFPQMRVGPFSFSSAFKSTATNSTVPVVGVGVAFQEAASGEKVVWKVAPNGPADRAGIVAGDIFVSIDGVDVGPMNLPQASSLCKGREGSIAVIGLKKVDGHSDTIRVARGTIPCIDESKKATSHEGSQSTQSNPSQLTPLSCSTPPG